MSTDPGMAAAVQRVMAAMDCRKQWDDLARVDYCTEHRYGWLHDVDACVRAESVARAAREDVRPVG